MASASVCRACMRSLRRQAGFITEKRLSTVHAFAPARPAPSSQHTRSYAARAAAKSLVDQAEDALAVSRASKRLGADAPLFAASNVQTATEALFKECARQADYSIPPGTRDADGAVPMNAQGEELGVGGGWWYEYLGLTPTFNTWAQVTFVHLYLLTARLRYFPPPVATAWLQALHDHFFWDAEHRMAALHGIDSRAARNRYLKDLYAQWRGAVGAYDEGLMRGDAVLGAAVWRNVWGAADARGEEVDWVKVAAVVAYMRRCLKALDGVHDRMIAKAMVKFGDPMDEVKVVEVASRAVGEAFGEEEERLLDEIVAGRKA